MHSLMSDFGFKQHCQSRLSTIVNAFIDWEHTIESIEHIDTYNTDYVDDRTSFVVARRKICSRSDKNGKRGNHPHQRHVIYPSPTIYVISDPETDLVPTSYTQ